MFINELVYDTLTEQIHSKKRETFSSINEQFLHKYLLSTPRTRLIQIVQHHPSPKQIHSKISIYLELFIKLYV